MGSKSVRRVLMWAAVALLLPDFLLAAAQTTSDPMLLDEIRSTRVRLQAQQPAMPTLELDRLAELLARSNHIFNAVAHGLELDDATNILRVLDTFPGKLDDLRRWNEP